MRPNPVLQLLAKQAKSLKDVEEMARKMGFTVFTKVLKLPRRVPRLGLRVKCTLVYAGGRLEALIMKGLEAEQAKMLSRELRVPVLIDNGGSVSVVIA